jgi:hypothetical protein
MGLIQDNVILAMQYIDDARPVPAASRAKEGTENIVRHEKGDGQSTTVQ